METNSNLFYTEKLAQHGNSAQGVGWKDEHAQTVRFAQLIKIISGADSFSVNDLGCGLGDFVNFLTKANYNYSYNGYDVVPDMIQRAKQLLASQKSTQFFIIHSAQEMQIADYSIASGIFNLPFTKSEQEWLKYIIETLHTMDARSTHGFAFNALTQYSDVHLMKKDLYYSDPLYLFDYCKKNFSRNVALLHDYDLYDFTILVRKKI